jgi:hypothetical protein
MWRIIVPVISRQSPHSSAGHDDHLERALALGTVGRRSTAAISRT